MRFITTLALTIITINIAYAIQYDNIYASVTWVLMAITWLYFYCALKDKSDRIDSQLQVYDHQMAEICKLREKLGLTEENENECCIVKVPEYQEKSWPEGYISWQRGISNKRMTFYRIKGTTILFVAELIDGVPTGFYCDSTCAASPFVKYSASYMDQYPDFFEKVTLPPLPEN